MASLQKYLDAIEKMELLEATKASYLDQGKSVNHVELNKIQKEILLFTQSIEKRDANTNRANGVRSYQSKMPKTREFEPYDSRIENMLDEDDDISAFIGGSKRNMCAVPFVEIEENKMHKKADKIPHTKFSSHDDLLDSLALELYHKKDKHTSIKNDFLSDDEELLEQLQEHLSTNKIKRKEKTTQSEIEKLLRKHERRKRHEYVHQPPNVICGLINKANYCYRNSIIQCLVSNATMVDKIKTEIENHHYFSVFDKFVADISTSMQSKNSINLNNMFPDNICLQYNDTSSLDSRGNPFAQNDPNQYLSAMVEDDGVIANFLRCNISFIKRIETKFGQVLESNEDGVEITRQLYDQKIVTYSGDGAINQKSLNYITTEVVENSLGTGNIRITDTQNIVSYPPFLCVQTSGKEQIPVTEGFSVSEVSEDHPERDPVLSHYELTSCVMRSGKPCGDRYEASINSSGHYVACVKKNNKWFVLVIIHPII